MRKIIIGKIGYDVIKYKLHLRKDEWANCIPCSIRIKMNIDDYLMLKCFVDSDDSLNFNSIENDGVYSCIGKVNSMIILSKTKSDVICKFDMVIWTKTELDESESRDVVLVDVLSF